MNKKLVYFFGEGNAKMKDLLGGKGANLAEMTNLGLPIPSGFTITTDVCKEYYVNNQHYPAELDTQLNVYLQKLEEKSGAKFGDPENPLLLSVRSGAPISMPGMMDTILNLGLTKETLIGLIQKTKDKRFVYDSYRRFLQMYGNVCLNIKKERFETKIEEIKENKQVSLDTELTTKDLQELSKMFKTIIEEETHRSFIENPRKQLHNAIEAVIKSWNSPRAIVYRKHNNISEKLGTAINIQQMVFGNFGNNSGTGVVFTRNPSTGEKQLYGEYLLNAQGEDVVAGSRTPIPIENLQDEVPKIFQQLKKILLILENHYRDVQDVEFTIYTGTLYILQTRTGKRTVPAAIKIAVDMVDEGLITSEEALMRIDAKSFATQLHRRIDPNEEVTVIAKGLPASPGAASGIAVFDADEAKRLGEEGIKVILVRVETTPEDIHGLVAAQGVVTSRGGMTSHAAVVARAMGKPCVAGVESIKVNLEKSRIEKGEVIVNQGDEITIDGSTGRLILGKTTLIDPEVGSEIQKILEWAKPLKSMQIVANADTPNAAIQARKLGATGIGLCRTERMFNAPDRLPIVQKMIMAETKEERMTYLNQLLPIQKEDFKQILRAMEGYFVTIRLLDPPLHEFLPNQINLMEQIDTIKRQTEPKQELAEKEFMLKRVRDLEEANPMLGLRGCRLGITHPEIYDMQIQAILEATLDLKKEKIDAQPRIMIPLVGHSNELKTLRSVIEEKIRQISRGSGVSLTIPIGTMIEIPRGALTANKIAKYADFFSFGTNDLTQTTFGYSRDDAEGKFLLTYLKEGILLENPFEVLDREGVGTLMKICVRLGRQEKPNLQISICGEVGGEPSSVEFCHQIGLNYVSTSPFRIPVAILAAAQATITHGRQNLEG